MTRALWYCLLTFSFIDRTETSPDEPQLTFEDLYQYGKYDYTDKNWPSCVAFMRRAMEDFQYFEDELVWCRRKCTQQVESPDASSFSQMHAHSERAICLLRCKRDKFTENRPPLKKMNTFYDFLERKPYLYLHICYWKMGELGMAVKNAYTYLVKNPDHKDTLDGLAFYMEQPGYDDSMLVDLLRRPYEEKYISGVKAYNEEDWNRCVNDLESSLEKTLEEDQRCRLLCEDKIDWSAVDGNPELDVLMTSMQASVVRCQHNCLYQLGLINGHNVGHLLASHFEYLHFCYYKLMRGTEAARSVANFLLFDKDPLMQRNKYSYSRQFNKDELFEPDQRIVEVYKQRTLEERYLKFIEEKFKFVNNEFPPEMQDDRKKFDDSISIEDKFDYAAVGKLLSQTECKALRSSFPDPHSEQILKELEERIEILWPTAKFTDRACSRESRTAACSRAVVLSIENDDCSEWLGAMHTGCAIVFCT
ncbi:unnamed protein product [Cylicocyclus nassatus]|uniref:Leprecan-like alpha-helical domain-containing protein n=1 Tax=Cylicocyclus nassatus TaxID=53992 RepID=A0AA36H441_CYLNA|nr:unnamed protein product [Cylicocyclus nassatus]